MLDAIESQPDDSELLRKAISLSPTTPEEAAKTIDRARLMDIPPDQYASMKEHFDPEIDSIERVPASIEKNTQSFLKESEQQAILAKDDLHTLNNFEKRVKYYDQQINEIPTLNRQINELVGKKMDTPDGKLSPGDEEYLQDMNSTMREINANGEALKKSADIGGGEQFAVEVGVATRDFIRSYWENKELVGGMIGTGAVLGGAAGLAVPVPGATIIGLKAGAVKGAVGAATVVGFLDAYRQTSRSLYNELSNGVDDQGQPLNIPHERLTNVSRGVGIISGVAAGLSGKALAKLNPVLSRFANPKLAAKYVGQSPAVLAKMDILGRVAKSMLSEGTEEGVEEFTQIVGSNFAKMDESEASFINAIDNSLNSETAQRVLRSAAVGGATGGLIQAVTGAPGYKGIKDQYAQIDKVTKDKTDVLETQNNMLELAEDIKKTKMNELAPLEMSKFKKKIFSAIGFDENVWFNLEEMRQNANTPEKQAAILKAVDPTGTMTKLSEELNAPLAISKADTLSVVTEFPEITDLMRMTPDGESPLEIRTEAKDFYGKLTGAEEKRKQVLADLGVDIPMTPEQQAQIDSVLEPVKESKYFKNETDYLSDSPIKEIDGVVSKVEAEQLNSDFLAAKLEVAKSLKADVDADFAAIASRQDRTANDIDVQLDIRNLDTELRVLDSFNDKKNKSEAALAAISSHKKKGFSPSAIDPKSLPEDLKAIYLDNEKLKKRKVFVEGGLNVEESAALNGIDSGAELLRILAETPTQKEIKANRAQRKIQIRNEINQDLLPARQAARDEAFSNMTKIHIREMKFLVSKEWPTVKRGIIKIASKLPTIESLNERAKSTISKMKIKDLSAKRFEMGEARSNKAALKNYLGSEWEQAYANKEKAALNNEFRKETLNALDKISTYEKFWKRVSKPSVQQELKDAGYFKAMNDFMSIYNLEGTSRNQKEQNSFNEFIKKQAAEGNWTPAVPDRLDNVQQPSKELTVEQYQRISEMGQYILHQAKFKNKLLKAAKDRKELRTAETIQDTIEEKTNAHYDYNPEKINKEELKTKDQQEVTQINNAVKTAISSFSSLETIISGLDEQKPDGYFYQLLGDPIAQATIAEKTENANLAERGKKIVEQFYGSMDKFQELLNERVEVPEFASFPKIGDGEGSVRKIDLIYMFAHLGDPDGKEALTNFQNEQGVNIDLDTITTVMDRELSENDASFAQNFFLNTLKGFEQPSFDLHKRVTGIEPDMIQGTQILHRGKILPGGYFPLRYQMLTAEARAAKELDRLQNKEQGVDEGQFYAKMASAEMTKQGRLKERTGSKRPIDLDYNNFFDALKETVHDLHFREVGIDTLKVLKNPTNAKNIKAVVGSDKFSVLLDSVKDVVSNSSEQQSALFAKQFGWVNKVINGTVSLQAIKTIGFNVGSAAIQSDALNYLALRAGPKAPIYLAKAAARLTGDISNYEAWVEQATKILPDIGLDQRNADESVVKSFKEFVPTGTAFFKNYPKLGKGVSRLRKLREKTVENSFYLLREADKANKVIATYALTEQFFNGDINGYPLDVVNKMSDAEKLATLRRVVKQTVDLTLTANSIKDKTPIEKIGLGKLLVNYWTDRRSRLNTIMAQVDKAKGAYKRGENAKAVNHMLWLSLATGSAAALQNLLRNDEESIIKRLGKAKSLKDLGMVGVDTAWDFAKSPVVQTVESIPVLDAAKYAYDTYTEGRARSFRPVSTPFFGVVSDITMGAIALNEFLESGLNLKKLDDKDRKILLTNAGYAMGGAPTSAVNKLIDIFESRQIKKGTKFLKDELKSLNNNIDRYIKENESKPEAKEFIDDLKEYKKTLPPDVVTPKNIIPDNTKEVIKQVSSQGDWKKYDPETGAAGVYQFTEDRWREIANTNPDLGLTENGRVSKDSSQQEKAMDWELQENTRNFLAFEIPVNEENILGAHKFGFDNFAAIHQSEDNAKLGDVLGKEAKNPLFKSFTTVKSIKNYLSREVGKVKELTDKQ